MVACNQKRVSAETVGKVEVLSEQMNAIVDADAKIERIGEGFVWAEGPVWIAAGEYLLFTDVPGNTMYKWSAGEGVTVFLKPSGYAGTNTTFLREAGANGLTLDLAGNLLMCDSGTRAVASVKLQTKAKSVLVAKYKGKSLNSPNDIVVHSSGNIYFTDPPYGLRGLNDSPNKELDFNGVYRLSPNGELTLLTKEFTFPNGLAFSPDEKTLYVAQSDSTAAIIKAFDVSDDGGLENGRIFFDATDLVKQGKKGLPDGMKVDTNGTLFVTGPGGVLVLSPDGVHLGTIATGEAVANCAFGNDGSVLYITSDMMLCRIQLKTKGRIL